MFYERMITKYKSPNSQLSENTNRVVGQVVSRVVKAQTRVQRSDRLEFIRSHIEIQDIQVLSKTGLVIRLGDNSNVAIRKGQDSNNQVNTGTESHTAVLPIAAIPAQASCHTSRQAP